jgi:hypothetical protein
MKQKSCEAQMDAAKGHFLAKHVRVVFILLGIAALVLKKPYSGPLQEVVWAYGGNVAVSFSMYFLMTFLAPTARTRRLLSASLALLVVQLFEASDGFGFMGNVYDPVDFVANAIGVGLAWVVDVAASRISSRTLGKAS